MENNLEQRTETEKKPGKLRRIIGGVVLAGALGLAGLNGCVTSTSKTFKIKTETYSFEEAYHKPRDVAETVLENRHYIIIDLRYKKEKHSIINAEKSIYLGGFFDIFGSHENYKTRIKVIKEPKLGNGSYRYEVSSKSKIKDFLDLLYFLEPWKRDEGEEKEILSDIEKETER